MRLKMISLIFFFALLLALSTYAQEPVEPLPTEDIPTAPPATETPMPTETLLPVATETAIPSLTPTATDTGIPVLTETPLITATSETTQIPTGSSAFTATPTPSLTASLQPTYDPFATLEAPFTTQIFDNFDNGALGIWQIGSGWSLVPNEGGQALQAQNTVEPVVMDDDTLYNVSIQVRVLLNAGAIPSVTSFRLFLRQSEMGEYSATLDADGFINVYRGTELLGATQVTASLPGQWRTFRFSAVEDVLRVWVDDLEIGSLSDPSPLPAGRVGFNADGEKTIDVTVDDVVVAWEALNYGQSSLLATIWCSDFHFNTTTQMQGWTLIKGDLSGAGIEGFLENDGYSRTIAISRSITIPQGSTIEQIQMFYTFDTNGSRGVIIDAFGNAQGAGDTFPGAPPNPSPFTWSGNYTNLTGTVTISGFSQRWTWRLRFVRLCGSGNDPFTTTPTPTLTPTITPTIELTPTIDTEINLLAEYGIIVYAAGLPAEQSVVGGTPWDWTLNQGRAWTLAELQAVRRGVVAAAGALNSIATSDPGGIGNSDGTTAEAKLRFRTIMGDVDLGQQMYVLRVTNDFEYIASNPGAGGCSPAVDEGCTNNPFDSIAFYGGLVVSEYTMVHELGHRFRNQSAIGVAEAASIYYQFQSPLNPPERDCGNNGELGPQGNDEILFGVVSSDWLRGVRGWGTTVTSGSFSDFQQNPFEDVSRTRNEDVPDEAFGDMFLNWVYRHLSTGQTINWADRCSGPAEIGSWLGFRNINDNGDYDPSEPGNARYYWMETKIREVFDQHPAW